MLLRLASRLAWHFPRRVRRFAWRQCRNFKFRLPAILDPPTAAIRGSKQSRMRGSAARCCELWGCRGHGRIRGEAFKAAAPLQPGAAFRRSLHSRQSLQQLGPEDLIQDFLGRLTLIKRQLWSTARGIDPPCRRKSVGKVLAFPSAAAIDRSNCANTFVDQSA